MLSDRKSTNPKSYTISLQHVIVRAESTDTNGICAVLEMHHPPNFGPPLHVHTHEDEGFLVTQGIYRFTVGEVERTLQAGEFIMAPRTVPHSFRCAGPEQGRMLVYLTPAGGEAYFEEMSRIAMDDPERRSKCQLLDRKYGIKILPRK